MAVAVDKLITSQISKPARYLGNELGAVHKPWNAARVRWVLTYPEIYEVGASNLGHIILYNIINAQPRQLCDRAYLPAPDLATKLRETQTPLFAVESRRSLLEFDILGFSLSYELGATNILEMLDLAGIPLTWRDRDRGNYPLIFAGGQTATSNPEPYADFFDFVALGDGEELLPEIGLIVEDGLNADLSREGILLDLAQVPGVYVPRFYDLAEDGSVSRNRTDVPPRILRRTATPIPAYSIGLVPYVQTVHDRLTIEVRRGCTRGCRFCQPGMLTRPARDVEPEKVIDAIEQGMRATGHNEFSLLSLSCSDYLSLPSVGMEIKNRLRQENISLSLPSQRVDRFDENIANILGGTRKSGLTFAPEAGTQRMRDIVNKGLTNEELLRGIKTAWEKGWDKIKLYFMIGLPGETDADVLGIAETVAWLQRECRGKKRKPLNFNLTISNFTPKPHTPFQWHSVAKSEFIRKQDLLRDAFRKMRNVKVNFTDVRISAMEDFIGRGDRNLGRVVRRAWELGAGMDAWFDSAERAYDAWNQAITEAGISWKYRQIENGEWNVMDSDRGGAALDLPLPWDHIDSGVSKKWLKDDLQKALAATVVPDCSFDACSHCGVCGTDFGHNIVINTPDILEFAGEFIPNTSKQQRVRVCFGKKGSMALVSHLDLMRLFDRAVRRAQLPVVFTGGYHPMLRIMIANALPLGATSTGELVDFELVEPILVPDFRSRLAAVLPDDIPIYWVANVNVSDPAATQILESAEYYLHISTSLATTPEEWHNWIEKILLSEEICAERTTKSGKVQIVNLRAQLTELQIAEVNSSNSQCVLRYIGCCRNDGTMLRPEQVVFMMEQVAGIEFDLDRVHRSQLILSS